MTKKPSPKSELAAKELDKVEVQFDNREIEMQQLVGIDKSQLPVKEEEPQTKLSQRQIAEAKDIYLKPRRTIGSPEKGLAALKDNENYKQFCSFAKERVRFVAENLEIIGEEIIKWTKPGPGFMAEEWVIPTNVVVNGPRYLAEELSKCSYTIYEMKADNGISGEDSVGTYSGRMIAKQKKQRLNAIPASTRKSVFMGSEGF